MPRGRHIRFSSPKLVQRSATSDSNGSFVFSEGQEVDINEVSRVTDLLSENREEVEDFTQEVEEAVEIQINSNSEAFQIDPNPYALSQASFHDEEVFQFTDNVLACSKYGSDEQDITRVALQIGVSNDHTKLSGRGSRI